MKKTGWTWISVVLLAFPLFLRAGEALDGTRIMENVYNRETGEDMRSELTMTLINSRGDQRVRKIRQFIRDFGKEEKKIMFFLARRMCAIPLL